MLRLLCLLPLLLLAACSTFDDRELARMRAGGAPPRIVSKMERGDPLTPSELIAASRGMPDSYLLRHLEDAGVDYLVTRSDAVQMRRGGVSARVIDAVLAESDRFAGDYAQPQGDVSVGLEVGGGYPLDDEFYYGW